ncbi:MAG: DegT/DnrJ/EryC1/StrS aminotransferase family protein [Nitrosopumilus sp.]|nr:DegT/DnrJ/EryC1/StrS aminotransferase family protein [Nitrosopumilus sp.]NRA04637.1 DegT/DnrJ/EryC1/StrS aminotransferase family protein [Nitrosopumilus sp.]
MQKRIYLMRPNVDSQEVKEIQKVIHSKFLTEGKVTQQFEKTIAKYTCTKYAVATTSATTALHTMFHCIGVKGKKVLVSDFTFPATILAIIQAGGKPILVDVDKFSMNVTREIIEDALNSSIKFIAPVSLFGNPLNIDFYGLRKQGVKIIEDGATNLGTKVNNRFVGSLADATCFSFHPRKIITTGEGGMITTNNKKLIEKIRSFKAFGKVNSKFVNIGTNYKLSDIQSAIGLAQMRKIEKIIKKRIKQAKIYNELLSKIDFIEPQKQTQKSRHTYQSYVCTISKQGLRDKIIKKLSQKNIESQIGTYALHSLPAFKKIPKIGKLENSEFLYKNSISLPLHVELSEKDQGYIYSLIKNV